jgi:hypothetical protein
MTSDQTFVLAGAKAAEGFDGSLALIGAEHMRPPPSRH